MVKQHSQVINFLMGVCDLTVVAIAWVGSYFIRFQYFPVEKELPTHASVFTNMLIVMLVSLAVLTGTVLTWYLSHVGTVYGRFLAH